jgi:hypothetical protein
MNTATKALLALLPFFPLVLASAAPEPGPASTKATPLETGVFRWRSSQPLVWAARTNQADPEVSIKDPTLVFHDGKWHMFATVRMRSGKVDTGYLSFSDFKDAGTATLHILGLHGEYYCAPQVFYFTPHRKWYLVYQLADKTRTPPFGPCFSTSATIDDPKAWTKPQPMITNAPAKPKWLDFWVICSGDKAHLFYTSLDGHMWRRETRISDFPFGWSEQTLAIQGDIFEASHTYKLKGQDQFLTLIEAQGRGNRYYKAYVAKGLAGPWRELAASQEKPFASSANVTQPFAWTASISHGELLRSSNDETLEVDPVHLRFVFQGASNEEYNRAYGAIPWRLGLLEQVAD